QKKPAPDVTWIPANESLATERGAEPSAAVAPAQRVSEPENATSIGSGQIALEKTCEFVEKEKFRTPSPGQAPGGSVVVVVVVVTVLVVRLVLVLVVVATVAVVGGAVARVVLVVVVGGGHGPVRGTHTSVSLSASRLGFSVETAVTVTIPVPGLRPLCLVFTATRANGGQVGAVAVFTE